MVVYGGGRGFQESGGRVGRRGRSSFRTSSSGERFVHFFLFFFTIHGAILVHNSITASGGYFFTARLDFMLNKLDNVRKGKDSLTDSTRQEILVIRGSSELTQGPCDRQRSSIFLFSFHVIHAVKAVGREGVHRRSRLQSTSICGQEWS